MSSTINNTGNYTCTANSGQNSATQTTTICVGGKLLPPTHIVVIFSSLQCIYGMDLGEILSYKPDTSSKRLRDEDVNEDDAPPPAKYAI